MIVLILRHLLLYTTVSWWAVPLLLVISLLLFIVITLLEFICNGKLDVSEEGSGKYIGKAVKGFYETLDGANLRTAYRAAEKKNK